MKKCILFIIGLGVMCLAAYAYFGGFSDLEFRVEEQGGETLVYAEVIGDYSQTGKAIDEVYQYLLQTSKIETRKGGGIFYGDPKLVEASKLRSEVGCILQAQDSSLAPELAGPYKVRVLPKTQYVVSEFPFKGIPSVYVAMIRLYPALRAYANEHGVRPDAPLIEIYDVPNGKTLYMMEVTE